MEPWGLNRSLKYILVTENCPVWLTHITMINGELTIPTPERRKGDKENVEKEWNGKSGRGREGVTRVEGEMAYPYSCY